MTQRGRTDLLTGVISAVMGVSLLVLLLAGAPPRQLESPRLLIGGPGDQRSPSWMPDGKRIVCSSAAERFPAGLYLFDLASGTSRPLTRDPSGHNNPAVSPDGRRILFHSDRGGQSDIYGLDLATSEVVQLTTNRANDSFAAWSPDGRQIAYCGGPMKEGHANLWIMNADGTGQRPLTERGKWDDFDPAFSPDGKRIAFESNGNGTFGIWVIKSEF